MPARDRARARGRRRLPSDVPCAGAEGRFAPHAGAAGELAVRGRVPGRAARAQIDRAPPEAGGSGGRTARTRRAGAGGAQPELGPILDEELAALPACYREAIVLCDLRGASREEAAVALGVPEGTLSSRLANGRKKLAARLTKRGVALSVAALPLAVAQVQAAVSVPNGLLSTTCGLVADVAAGGAAPGALARLADGGFAMRKVLVLGAAMALGVAGMVLAAQPREAPPVDPPKPPALAEGFEPAPQPKGDPNATDKPLAYTTAPRLTAGWDVPITDVVNVVWSPDGATLAVVGWENVDKGSRVFHLLKYPSDAAPKVRVATVLPNNVNLVGFTPDGKHVVTDQREHRLLSGHHKLHWWNPAKADTPPGGLWPRPDVLTLVNEAKVRSIDFDGELVGYAFPPDSKTFRTLRFEQLGAERKVQVMEVDATTGKTAKSLMTLGDAPFIVPADAHHILTRDGKRLAVLDNEVTKVTVYDVDRAAKVSEYAFPDEYLKSRPSTVTRSFPDERLWKRKSAVRPQSTPAKGGPQRFSHPDEVPTTVER
ncbi:MAG: hypothetical protein FJ304_23900, partial [Planctomycetes bacterium]|nr:hypothetical protein [Planctomycetota bacterium]